MAESKSLDESSDELDNPSITSIVESIPENKNEDKKFSISEIFYSILIGIVSILLFTILIFPYEELLRTYLFHYQQTTGIVLDFKKLDFSYIGTNRIDSFLLMTKNDIYLKMEEININSNLFSIYNGNLNGNYRFTATSFESSDYDFNIKNINLESSLIGIFQGVTKLTGKISLELTGGTILKSPDFPMIGILKDVEIKSIFLDLKSRNGEITIESGKINSSIASITVSGTIRLNENIGYSAISIDLCPKLTPKFANEREDIANTLILLSKAGNSCFNINGTFSQPKANLPTAPEVPTGE